jgi:hypothetical protein
MCNVDYRKYITVNENLASYKEGKHSLRNLKCEVKNYVCIHIVVSRI